MSFCCRSHLCLSGQLLFDAPALQRAGCLLLRAAGWLIAEPAVADKPVLLLDLP